MVRFIIYKKAELEYHKLRFTFQYGQIYYWHNLDYSEDEIEDLHSNMVRFIMLVSEPSLIDHV